VTAATAPAVAAFPPWVSPAIAGLALAVSGASYFVSYRKYSADQTTPWVQILLKYIEDELKALARDASLFAQIYSVPFETLDRKATITKELNSLRDESLRRLDALASLTAAAEKLRGLRATLNAVTDSFYDNAELSLPDPVACSLRSRYEQQSRAFVIALQEFARNVCKRKQLFPGG